MKEEIGRKGGRERKVEEGREGVSEPINYERREEARH